MYIEKRKYPFGASSRLLSYVDFIQLARHTATFWIMYLCEVNIIKCKVKVNKSGSLSNMVSHL